MIGNVRALIASMLDGSEWPVYTWKPDDVTVVPCIVVDRPTIASDVQLHSADVPVVVIGRKDGGEDSQNQLDAVASDTYSRLAGPDTNVNRMEPATAAIADQTYPAYLISVSCGFAICTGDQP